MSPVEPRPPATPTGLQAEERLRDAAVALFAKRGFQAVGIRELATAANLSTASLYHYMRTKDDLLIDIMERSQRILLDMAYRSLTDLDRPETRVAALTQVHVIFHSLYQQYCLVGDTEVRSLPPARRDQIISLRDEYEDLWQTTIENGSREQVFMVRSHKLARISAIEMCTGVAHWYSPKGPLSVTDLALSYCDMILAMLRTRRQHMLRIDDLSMPPVNYYESLVIDTWEARNSNAQEGGH